MPLKLNSCIHSLSMMISAAQRFPSVAGILIVRFDCSRTEYGGTFRNGYKGDRSSSSVRPILIRILVRRTARIVSFADAKLGFPEEIPKWVPPWILPHLNILSATLVSGETYNPVVDGRELWPHESPDVWAVPAEEPNNERASNNNLSINSKEAVASGSHSSIDLEWENDEGNHAAFPLNHQEHNRSMVRT